MMRMAVEGDEEPQGWYLLGCWGFGGALSLLGLAVAPGPQLHSLSQTPPGSDLWEQRLGNVWISHSSRACVSCIPAFSLAGWNVGQPAQGHGTTPRLESGGCCLCYLLFQPLLPCR